MMGYIDVWESYGGRHINADKSPIIEGLYGPKLEMMDIRVAGLLPLLF